MTVAPPIDPNKDATYQITLGSTFDDAPRQSFHALKCTLLHTLPLIVELFGRD